MPALRGVFHEAGVLDDGVLSQQTWSRFERVMNSKVQGAWHLHELTRDLPLDFFVLFSSAAAVLGSAGQANYAAANSFLDGLAQYRRSIGLPATSINWGAWSEVGMASRGSSRRGARAANSIHPTEGMQILEKLIHRQSAQVVALPMDWNRIAGKPIQPILRQIVKVKEQPRSSVPVGQMLEQIRVLPAHEQIEAFHEYAKQQVINILGLNSLQSFNSDRALTDLGLDSLMAVELKNKIEGDLRMNIPVTYFLEGVTVAALSKKLHEQFSERDGSVRSSDQTVDAEKAKELLSNLDRLSEDEVDSLIGNLLASNEDS
jgi:acyl carrier protein